MPEKLGARSDLAAALRVLRQLRGLEQEELAAASGVSYALIAKIEHGHRHAHPGNLSAILGALEIEPSILDELVDLIHRLRRRDAAGAAPVTEGSGTPRGDAAAVPELLTLQVLLGTRLGAGTAQAV